MAATDSALLNPLIGGGSRSASASAVIATSVRDITPRDRHRLLADAMKRSSQNVSRDRIVRSLTEGGFAEAKAMESLGTIEQQLIGKRQAFDSSRQRAIVLAHLQIWVSILFAILGMSVSGITSLIVFGVSAGRGVQRLKAAKHQVFSNDVLTHR